MNVENDDLDFLKIYLEFDACFDPLHISNNPNDSEIQKTVCFLYRHLRDSNFTLDYLYEMMKESCPVAAESKANQMLDAAKVIFDLRECEEWKKEHH